MKSRENSKKEILDYMSKNKQFFSIRKLLESFCLIIIRMWFFKKKIPHYVVKNSAKNVAIF